MASKESPQTTKKLIATAESESPKRTRVESGDVEITVGAPASPLQHLFAAFAGCINATGHQVAREMDVCIDDLEIGLEGGYDPAVFMGENTDDRAGFNEFEIDVDVDSDADRETLETWLDEVERRCPVSDNLQAETPTSLSLETR
jgi:uncharacterized OsmC-like protein